jgi:hypothetical protein
MEKNGRNVNGNFGEYINREKREWMSSSDSDDDIHFHHVSTLFRSTGLPGSQSCPKDLQAL